MTQKELKKIKTWFENYVDTYRRGSINFTAVFRPKLKHCYNVADFCRTLSNDLVWPHGDAISAEAAGILHDIGRFSQFTEFGNFIDNDSVNHGVRGYEIVNESGITASLSIRDSQIILDGIRYHNNNEFSHNIQPENIPFLLLVRDADKIDKFRITLELIEDECNGKRLTVQCHGPINPVVIKQIRGGKPVSKKNIQSTLDFYLFRLSSVFDIHYSETYKRISESGILQKIISRMPQDKSVQTASELMLSYLGKHASAVD